MKSSAIKTIGTFAFVIAGAAAFGLVVGSSTGCSKSDSNKDKAEGASKTTSAGHDMSKMKKGEKMPMDHGKMAMDHGKMAMDHGKMAMGDKPMAPMDHTMMKGGREVAISVDAEGFHPDEIPAKPSEHLKLVFTRTSDKGCGTQVVVHSTGQKYDLPLNKPVDVHLMAGKQGRVEFACGMNMLKGSVVVAN